MIFANQVSSVKDVAIRTMKYAASTRAAQFAVSYSALVANTIVAQASRLKLLVVAANYYVVREVVGLSAIGAGYYSFTRLQNLFGAKTAASSSKPVDAYSEAGKALISASYSVFQSAQYYGVTRNVIPRALGIGMNASPYTAAAGACLMGYSGLKYAHQNMPASVSDRINNITNYANTTATNVSKQAKSGFNKAYSYVPSLTWSTVEIKVPDLERGNAAPQAPAASQAPEAPQAPAAPQATQPIAAPDTAHIHPIQDDANMQKPTSPKPQ